MEEQIEVSIVIPTLNEEQSIGRVLEGIKKQLPDAEIIVVDSSYDKTAEIASSFGAMLIKQDKKGYGAAIRAGLNRARGKVIAFMDGDGTYDPGDLKKLIDIVRRGDTDVATGLRFSSKPVSMSTARYIGNFIVNIVFSLLFLKRIRDTQTGMKVFSRGAYLKMRLKENGMPFSTEVLTEACRKSLRITEVRIGYHNRLGVSKLNMVKDGVRILLFMVRERLHALRN